MASDCLSRWGEARWGDARWGEVTELVVILAGTATPTATLSKTPVLFRGGTLTPGGTLTLPPEWTVVRPPSHPGGYPSSTRLRGTGATTRKV